MEYAALVLHVRLMIGASPEAVEWLLTLLQATKHSQYTTVMAYVSVTKKTLTTQYIRTTICRFNICIVRTETITKSE